MEEQTVVRKCGGMHGQMCLTLGDQLRRLILFSYQYVLDGFALENSNYHS